MNLPVLVWPERTVGSTACLLSESWRAEAMIELGYMAKRIVAAPDWISVPDVTAICAVSNCISSDFADYISAWMHNRWWCFDTPQRLAEAAEKLGVSLQGCTLLYYQAYDLQYDRTTRKWSEFDSDLSVDTHVEPPCSAEVLGWDIVCYEMQSTPECSLLSCNAVAEDVSVNSWCLLDTQQSAISVIESGLLENAEPGPLRLIRISRCQHAAGAVQR